MYHVSRCVNHVSRCMYHVSRCVNHVSNGLLVIVLLNKLPVATAYPKIELT